MKNNLNPYFLGCRAEHCWKSENTSENSEAQCNSGTEQDWLVSVRSYFLGLDLRKQSFNYYEEQEADPSTCHIWFIFCKLVTVTQGYHLWSFFVKSWFLYISPFLYYLQKLTFKKDLCQNKSIIPVAFGF